MKNKVCKNCGYEIDKPRDVYFEQMNLKDIGKNVYYSILDGKYKSIELCNLCYTTMQYFRHSLPINERQSLESKNTQFLT